MGPHISTHYSQGRGGLQPITQLSNQARGHQLFYLSRLVAKVLSPLKPSPVSKPIYTCKWMCVCLCEWERTHLLICVYEWERELTSLPSNHTSNNLLTNRILDGRTDPDTPKRIPITLSDTHYGHTQEDTHYTEWYGYPEWFFLSVTVLTTHPRVYPLPWGTLFSSQTNRTLSDTHDSKGNKPDIEWYPWQ
jgi:hypothetical protein